MTLKKITTAIILTLGGAVVFIFVSLYYGLFLINRSRSYLLGLSLTLPTFLC